MTTDIDVIRLHAQQVAEGASATCPVCMHPFAETPEKEHRSISDPRLGVPAKVCHETCENRYRALMNAGGSPTLSLVGV